MILKLGSAVLILYLLEWNLFVVSSDKVHYEQDKDKKENKDNATAPVRNSTTNSTKLGFRDIAQESIISQLTDDDKPNCTIKFRPESNFNYFIAKEISENVFVIRSEDREQNYSGSDPYLANIFNGSQVPPYVRIECLSTYNSDFRFEGVESLQFLRIWKNRVVSRKSGTTKIVNNIGIEVLLPSSATGKYIIYNKDIPSKRVQFFIFSESESAPYLLGRDKKIKRYYHFYAKTIPCISSNPNVPVNLFWKSKEEYIPVRVDEERVLYNRQEGFTIYSGLYKSNKSSGHSELEFQSGEFKCTTGNENDVVYGKVDPYPEEERVYQENPKGSTGLAIKLANGGAYCVGSPGSNVRLVKYAANPAEGRALVRCLQQRFSPCGSSFHFREDGYPISSDEGNGGKSYISVFQKVPPTSYLVCLGDDESFAIRKYFTGFDGKIYNSYKDAPVDALLRLHLESDYDNGMELLGGRRYIVGCQSAEGVFGSDPRLVYVNERNNNSQIEELNAWGHNYARVAFTSRHNELICNNMPWDSSHALNLSRAINPKFVPCEPSQFQCYSEECIQGSYRCDQYVDCSDGFSDETNCTSYTRGCRDGEFTCDNGRCIYKSSLCNARNDCFDNSDENPELCSNCTRLDKFSCGNGDCISNDLRCNGVNDCGNGADESDDLCHDCRTSYLHGGFRCKSGIRKCIPASFKCDGTAECKDESDEDPIFCQDCGGDPSLFKCTTSGKCVSNNTLCDGYDNCGMGEDEANSLCHDCLGQPNKFHCKSGKCIPRSYTCDADLDCSGDDSSDESPELCSNSRPIIVNSDRTISLHENEDRYIVCNVIVGYRKSKDQLTIDWYRDGELMPSDRTFARSENTTSYQYLLLFPRVQDSDKGLYKCVAKNIWGSTERDFMVEILSQGSGPSQNQTQEPTQPTTTTSTTTTSTTTTTTSTPSEFQCKEEGRFPDPMDCHQYHECHMQNRTTTFSHFSHFRFDCGPGTVYCPKTQDCGWESNCPCRPLII